MSKPCGRCGAGDAEYGETPAYCAEVEVAFGLLAWLCFDCRKEYHRFAKNHQLNKQYGEALLRLEFWRDTISPDTPPEEIEVGIKLWNIVDDLQSKVNDVANQWMISDPDELR